MSSTPQRYRVLVVDDSPIYRKLIEHVLAGEAYSLLFAEDGREALELYREHSPSIIITDWMMPDLSGIDLCRQIRADKTSSYTYIILMTGNTERANVVKGLQAGADDYLTKPFDHAEMLARIGVGRRIVELHAELAATNRSLELAAQTDSLTQLLNRRAIEEWATKYLKGAYRHGYYFWVAVCDIDSFKKINDTFGHEAGDIVLRSFADLLRASVRSSDMCGRLGGDEFVIVITHVSPEHIELTFERLREKFASLAFPFGGQSFKVTASFGVVGFKGKDAHEFKTLLRNADRMLYEAKRHGRNRVRLLTLEPAGTANSAKGVEYANR